MLTIEHPDGTLTVTDTAECIAYIQYENRLSSGPDVQVHEYNGVRIMVIKHPGIAPEELLAFAYGQTYSVMVEDSETGTICVPVPLGA